jgi:hypothetical protein
MPSRYFAVWPITAAVLQLGVIGSRQDQISWRDICKDLPPQLAALAERTVDANDRSLGAVFSQAMTGKEGSKEAAIKAVFGNLPTWLQGDLHQDLVQASTGSGPAAYWYCITIMACRDLALIEAAENKTGEVLDYGWLNQRRRFALTTTDDTGKTMTNLEQIRMQIGAHWVQRSQYYWKRGRYLGSGIDWLIPIVASGGSVAGHLLLSIYSHNYEAPNDHELSAQQTQLSAVRKWSRLAEDEQAAADKARESSKNARGR